LPVVILSLQLFGLSHVGYVACGKYSGYLGACQPLEALWLAKGTGFVGYPSPPYADGIGSQQNLALI